MALSTGRAVDVRVNTTLTSHESAELDDWLGTHKASVSGVEIHARCVVVHGEHPYLTATATATATRQPGQLADALNDAFHRLHAEGGGS